MQTKLTVRVTGLGFEGNDTVAHYNVMRGDLKIGDDMMKISSTKEEQIIALLCGDIELKEKEIN